MADIKRFSSMTPMMRQYFEIKQKFPDALVFYRLGDFYELFYDDAKVVSSLLDLTLTRRNSNSNDPIPMAGVPYQSADGYIAKLIKQGRSVVLCDQVGEKNAKGMMDRKVTRIITPGTVTDENMLSDNEDNIIACVFEEQGVLGLSTLSISSGRYTASEFNSFAGLSLMLSKLNPAELLYPERFKFYQGIQSILCRKALPLWEYNYDTCYASLCNQFRTRSLNGFGIEKLHAGVCAAGALLCYVKNTQSTPIEHVRSICLEDYSSFVVIDKTARKNLELTETLSGDHDATLFDILDKTSTPMGSRQLRSMLVTPLRNNAEVERRLDLVESLQHTSHGVELTALFQAMGDLERIVARIGLRKAQPRDLSTLRDAIKLLPQLKSLLRAGTSLDYLPVAITSARASKHAQAKATTDSTAAQSVEGKATTNSTAAMSAEAKTTADSTAALSAEANASATAHADEATSSADSSMANSMENCTSKVERSAATTESSVDATSTSSATTSSASRSQIMAAISTDGSVAVSEDGATAAISDAQAVAHNDARSSYAATTTGVGGNELDALGGDMDVAVGRDVDGVVGTHTNITEVNDVHADAGLADKATAGSGAVALASLNTSIISSSTVVQTSGASLSLTDWEEATENTSVSEHVDSSATESVALASSAAASASAALVDTVASASSPSHGVAEDDSLSLPASIHSMCASDCTVESTTTTMQACSIASNEVSSVATEATGNTMANAMEATAAKALDNAFRAIAADDMTAASASHSAKAAYHAMDEASSDWAKDLIVSSAASFALSGAVAQFSHAHALTNTDATAPARPKTSTSATAALAVSNAAVTAPATTKAESTAHVAISSTATAIAAATAADRTVTAATARAVATAHAVTEDKGSSTTSTAADSKVASSLAHNTTGEAGTAMPVTDATELEASASQTTESYTAAHATMAEDITSDSRATTDRDTKHYADDDANWNADVRIYDHTDADSAKSGDVCSDSYSNRLCDFNHYQSGAVSNLLGKDTEAAVPASASASSAASSSASAPATAPATASSAPASEADASASVSASASALKHGSDTTEMQYAAATAADSRSDDTDDSEIISEIDLAQMHRAFEHACFSALHAATNKRAKEYSSLTPAEATEKAYKALIANCGSPRLTTMMVPPVKKRTSKTEANQLTASSSSLSSSSLDSVAHSSASAALTGNESGTGSLSDSGKDSTAQPTDNSVADCSISVATVAMATTASGVAADAEAPAASDTNSSVDAIADDADTVADVEATSSAADTAITDDTDEAAQAKARGSVDIASSQDKAMAEAVASANADTDANNLSGATAASHNKVKAYSAADGDVGSVNDAGQGLVDDAGVDADTDRATGDSVVAADDSKDAVNATDVDAAAKAKDLATASTTRTSNSSLTKFVSGNDDAIGCNEQEHTLSSSTTDVGDKDEYKNSLKSQASVNAKAATAATDTATARISKGSTTSVTATANGSATGKKHLATNSKATTAKSPANGLSKDAVASEDCSCTEDSTASDDASCSAKSTVGSKKKATRSKSKARVSKANAVAPTRASITATDTHGEAMPTEHARVHDESDAHQLDSDGSTESVKRSSRGGHKKRSNKDKYSESESNCSKSTTNTACSESLATCDSQAQSSSALSTEDKSIVSQALHSDESSELGSHDADSMHDGNECSAVVRKNQAMGLDEHEASEHMDGDAISDTDSKTEVVADMDSFDYDDEELDASAVIEAIAQAAEKLIEAEDELAETAEEDALEQVDNLHPITIDGERALRASEIEAFENAQAEEALARARAAASTTARTVSSATASAAASATAAISSSTVSTAVDASNGDSSAQAFSDKSVKDSTRAATDAEATPDSYATESSSISTTASTNVADDESAATAASGADVDTTASASSATAEMDVAASVQDADGSAAASHEDAFSPVVKDANAVSTEQAAVTHVASQGASSDVAHHGDASAQSYADDASANVCDVSTAVDNTMDTDDAVEVCGGNKSFSSTGVAHSQSMGADGTHTQSNVAYVARGQSKSSDAAYVQGNDEREATCSGSSNSTNAGKSGTAGTATCDSSNNGPASGSDTCTSADADTVAETRADSSSMSHTGMDSEACAVSGGHSCDSEDSYSSCSSSSSGGDLSVAEANSSCSCLSDAEANASGMGKFDTVLKQRAEMLPDLDDVLDLLLKSINETPSATLRDGDVIANGYSKELDELRDLQSGSENTLLKIEAREKMRTGINSLKVRFNSIHGYYIEVSKAYSDKVPADYIRRQTLKNTERYITEELKELEDKTISAKTRALQLEKQIYDMLIEDLIKYLPDLSSFAHNIALLDSSFALAKTAKAHHFVRPQLSDKNIIKIVNGRHPVVEAIADRPFVANSIELRDGHNLAVISGPNMGGKSTFMRQVALISILARMGSFVPAQSAVIGDIDRIFTRIGASDDLASGRSTFMVEMEETATILNNATEHSLVIMDEVGRGTSGAEGAAIAEAIVQYLAKSIHPKTLFATHYTEVTTLVEIYPNAFNLCFNALKVDDSIVFLYQAQEGRQDRSFGIEVAKLAGIPANITKNAIGFYIARSKDLVSTASSCTTAYAQLSNGHTQSATSRSSTASPSIAATASTGDSTSASAEMATAAAATTTAEMATDATAVCADANAAAANGAGAAVVDGAIQSSSATHAHGAIDTMALASQTGAGADARAGTDVGAEANARADAEATAIAQDDAGDGYSDSSRELDEAIALYGNIMSESVAQISQRLVTTQAHLIESKAQKETLEIELSKTQELMNFIKGIELENLSPIDAVALLGTLRERAYAL